MNPPPVPPHSDLSGIGYHHHHHHNHQRLPSTPERTHSQNFVKTPSRRDLPPIPSNQKPFPQHSGGESLDFDMKEEMRQRELEEVRARVAQMEKTMRWWSDCTANWREKWSKVRNERNQSREECRSLKFKLETLVNENNNLKKLQQKTEHKLKRLSDHDIGLESKSSHSDGLSKYELNINEFEEDKNENNNNNVSNNNNNNNNSNNDEAIFSKSMKLNLIENNKKSSTNINSAPQKISETADDANKLIEDLKKRLDKETKERLKLADALSSTSAQLDKLTEQYEELRKMKFDCDEEIVRLRQWKDERMEAIRSDLEDGMMSDTNGGPSTKLTDLHKELEKLQVENAKEWALREKLETEKLALDRENKKLTNELNHVTEELNRCRLHMSAHPSNSQNVASMELEELNEKTKELSELKHSHNRLKKQLQERTSELEHSRSRAEHYELEVKKLRGRIEELKRDLVNAEDENDQQSMSMKKMQRNMEELQQQIDNYNMQLQHLQSRLKRSRTSLVGSDDGDDSHCEQAAL